jgi:hypothetical protein
MKRFGFAGLVLIVLLFAAQVVSAQDGSPSCPGESAYDLTGHGCVMGYTNGSAAVASIAPKVAGLAQPASTTKATPFEGSWDSSETPTFVPAPPPGATTMFVDGTASGNATLLGKYTATFKATVDLGCGCSQGDSIHFIAANGDSLYGLGQGVGVPDKPGFNRVTQAYTIMGGTGRFVGATGNFIVIRLANNATGVSKGSFDGSIVIPNEK